MIDVFGANDTVKFNAATVEVEALGKLYLDGGSNTYLHQVSADYMQLVVGGQIGLAIQEGATNATEVNVVPGAQNTLATDTVDGFLYMPETATTEPSGTPTAYTGKAAFCFDPAQKILWIYNTDASAWEGVTLA